MWGSDTACEAQPGRRECFGAFLSSRPYLPAPPENSFFTQNQFLIIASGSGTGNSISKPGREGIRGVKA